MKTCRIYSLSYCQTYNTVFTMVTMLYITPPGLTDFITGMLYLLTAFTHSPLPSGNHWSVHSPVICERTPRGHVPVNAGDRSHFVPSTDTAGGLDLRASSGIGLDSEPIPGQERATKLGLIRYNMETMRSNVGGPPPNGLDLPQPWQVLTQTGI